MPTLILDEQLAGYADYLRGLLAGEPWAEFAVALGVRVVTFADAGMPEGVNDRDLWRFCQAERLYLLTDNRNADGPTSLQATILAEAGPDSLPVFTIGSRDRFANDGVYAHRIVDQLLTFFFDGNNLGGTGRLFLPRGA